MFIYALSIFLTSTAFESTNAKIRHTSFEIYRISENCPLGYEPNGILCFLYRGLRKRYYWCALLRFRTPTGYEINEKVESILIDKLEFDYLFL